MPRSERRQSQTICGCPDSRTLPGDETSAWTRLPGSGLTCPQGCAIRNTASPIEDRLAMPGSNHSHGTNVMGATDVRRRVRFWCKVLRYEPLVPSRGWPSGGGDSMSSPQQCSVDFWPPTAWSWGGISTTCCDPDNPRGSQGYYRGFRDSSGAKWVYGACMAGQMVVAVVALVVAWGRTRRRRPLGGDRVHAAHDGQPRSGGFRPRRRARQ